MKSAIVIDHKKGKDLKSSDGEVIKKAKKPKERTVKEEDKARLVGGKDFAMIAVTFEDKASAMSATEAEIKRLIRVKIGLKKGYRTMADVPVKPLTRVFQYRLSDKYGDKKMVYEVARSRRTEDGKLFYATTHGQKALSFEA